MTVVAGAASVAAGTPVATSALNSRAPSRWTGSPTAATASNASGGHGAPSAGMWVFSTHTSPGRTWWCSAASTAQRTSSAEIVPSASSSVVNCTPALRPPAPFS
jgi:hypothetical protein